MQSFLFSRPLLAGEIEVNFRGGSQVILQRSARVV